MRGGPHIQERRWLHAPGVSTCLSQEERDSSSSAPGPARPTEGADAHSLTPWSRTGTGTLQPKSEGLGVKRRRPSAGHPQATETGGGSIQGTRAEPLSRPGPRVPPAPPSPSFLPRRFLSLLSCRGVTDALARKWGNRKKRAPPSPPRPADLGLPEGRAALGAAFAASPSAVLGWLRRGPMEAVPPPPPPRESQQVAPPLCPQAPEAPSQQVFLRRRPVRGGASGGSRVPQPCACRTLLRASPLFGHSASLGPGMVAEWPALQPGTCRGPSTLSPWAPLGRSLTGLCRRVGSTCSSVAHAASRLQKGCHASCVCVCIPLSPCSGVLPPTQPQRLQGISALWGVHLPAYIHG